jgi:hypothetical protein
MLRKAMNAMDRMRGVQNYAWLEKLDIFVSDSRYNAWLHENSNRYV